MSGHHPWSEIRQRSELDPEFVAARERLREQSTIVVDYGPLPPTSRPIIRHYWQETKSVQQVAGRCCISLGLAHRLIVAMLQEDGEE